MSDPADLTGLEAAALRMLLYGDYPALAHLREQLETCRVAKRTMTGAGFYTDLDCAAAPTPRLVFHAILSDVHAEIAGLEMHYVHRDGDNLNPSGQTRDWATLEHDLLPGAPKQA